MTYRKKNKVLYLFWVGFEFGTRHAHAKEVPVSNTITLYNFVLNVALKSSERD